MKYTYMYNIKNNASRTSGVYWENIRLFKPWKINVVNHINRLKGKNHMILLMNSENHLTKFNTISRKPKIS